MVQAQDYRSTGQVSISGRGECVVFLGKPSYSYSASPHLGVYMGTGKMLKQPERLDYHLIQVEVHVILLGFGA